MRGVLWCSVLHHGNRQHQPLAPAAPWTTVHQGGEERRQQHGCPNMQALPLLTYEAHLENRPGTG